MNPMKMAKDEIALIEAFVQKARRERLRSLIVNPRRRKHFVQELAHFKWLDQRHIRTLAPNAQNPDAIAEILRQKGSSRHLLRDL
jgi:hypothetical protein